LDTVRSKEENKKSCDENSIFKEYNEFEKLYEKKVIPIYNLKGEIR